MVVCQRFRDPRLYPQLVERLAPGGLLVVTVLSEVGDEPGPLAGGARRAARRRSAGWWCWPTREGNGEAGLLARRP